MALKYPDNLTHNNPNAPLLIVEDNAVQGLAHVDDIAGRDNIPTDKRCEGALVVVAGVPYVYQDSDLGNWTVPGAWKNLTPAEAGISLADLGASTAAPSGTGLLQYNDTNGIFTLTPPDISGKADQSALNGVISDVADNAADIATNAGNISSNTSAIAGKVDQGDFDTLETQVNTNTTNIAGAVGNITGNANDISDLQLSQGVQDGRLDAIETEQTTQNGNISANTSAIAGKADDADLTALEGRVTTAESDIDDLETSQGVQDGLISANTSAIAGKADDADLTALEGRVTTAEGDISANATAIAGKVGDILAGDNVTVDQAGDVYTINAADAAEPVTTQEFTVTDPIGSIELNDVIAVGTDLEEIIRNMLVSFQVPTLNITSPQPGTIEHNVPISFSNVSFNRTNEANINAAVDGLLEYNDPQGSNDESVIYTPNGTGSQTVSLSVSDTPVVTGVGAAGTSGTPKQRTNAYYIRVTEEDTEGNDVVRQENYTVQFRTYFGASNIVWTGSAQTASLITAMHSNKLEADSRTTWTTTVANDDNDNWTFLIMPTCHWTDAGGITEINQGVLPAFGAFGVIGSDVYEGCEYTIIKSNQTKAFAPGLTIEVL